MADLCWMQLSHICCGVREAKRNWKNDTGTSVSGISLWRHWDVPTDNVITISFHKLQSVYNIITIIVCLGVQVVHFYPLQGQDIRLIRPTADESQAEETSIGGPQL